MLHRKKSAFSLFSFSIYLILVVLLVSISLPLFFRIVSDMATVAQKQTTYIELSRVMSLITYILNSVNTKNILHHDHHTIIWESQEKHQAFSWEKKQNKFYFIEGVYDTKTVRWKERKKSLLSYHVIPLFSFTHTQTPVFEITLSCKEQSISRSITPFLRVYPCNKVINESGSQ